MATNVFAVSREGDRGGSLSPPSPWASPTKPPEVRKPRPFWPPLLNILNLSSSASYSNSLLRRKEKIIEKVKGSEMARENRKSGKENVELGTQEREASQGRQVLQKGKKKASSVLSFEEEMETWLVQGQTSIIINYWCFCFMNFQELPCAHLGLMKAIIRWKVLQETWGGHTRQEPGRPWAPW